MEGFRFLDAVEDIKYTHDLTLASSLRDADLSMQEFHNLQFIKEEQERYKDFFDSVEKNPLTSMQREAVVSNEKANLVISGAGSGKTSVMVARVGYAMQKYNLSPKDILVVAFGSDAAKELKERIEERLGIEKIQVSTFHAFGQNAIAKATGKKPSLAPWAENIGKKAQLIEKISMELSDKDTLFEKKLLEFFSYPFAQYKSEFSFRSEKEYRQYIQENKIISLKGDIVKSYEECEIANFFFLNGINYAYEAQYQYDTATEEHRQYQPDFYLPDFNIYLEHFGIDREGNTAPFVNRAEYHQGIDWKRAIHSEYGTKLIETYSYYQREGVLLLKLEEIVRKKGIRLSPRNIFDALADLDENTLFSEFSKTMATFIGHYKSNDHTMEVLRKRVGNSERLNAFLDLFEPVLNSYEAIKESKNVIDFDDMIGQAIGYIEEGKSHYGYRCILVDEYQDISVSRARMVKALHSQINNCVLTVVGDDWQSIYRFAGSEISLFHQFESYFGYARKIKLDYTFRYNDKISSVSQKFIEANPNQIKKEIKTLVKAKEPMVHIWWGEDKSLNKCIQILDDFQKKREEKDFSVYLLGRNRFSFPNQYQSLSSLYPASSVQALTVHKSKGLESDIVIVSGVSSGKVGFPSSIQGDPLLDIALAKQESFEYAEERRLFYVAMTRAKEEVHILASDINISSFARELEENEYDVHHHYRDNMRPQKCPKCELGTLVIRTGTYGNFWGCSQYGGLECDYTAPIYYCKEKGCGGILQLDKNKRYYVCNNEKCDHRDKACPLCSAKLVMRFNKRQNNRPFLGCSGFGKTACPYTENIKY